MRHESVCQQYLNFTSASSASESEQKKKVVDIEKSKSNIYKSVKNCKLLQRTSNNRKNPMIFKNNVSVLVIFEYVEMSPESHIHSVMKILYCIPKMRIKVIEYDAR